MAFASRVWTMLCKIWFGFLGSYPTTSSYSERISQLSKYSLGDIVDNFDASHAATAIENIYIKAAQTRKPIRIITGHFNPVVYENLRVRDAFSKCIKNKVDIKIVVTESKSYLENEIAFVQELAGKENINIAMSEGIATPHMIVVGDKGAVFRYETNCDTYNGKVSFNSPEVGRNFVKTFDELYLKLSNEAVT
ncbi:hypothetical protein N9850_08610 [Granulosicoccus sp.]|nr:hypothetical protein [Granulosicoccus sp.]MDB4223821.1 hypothetical protein [Granulosicoccus sp.]